MSLCKDGIMPPSLRFSNMLIDTNYEIPFFNELQNAGKTELKCFILTTLFLNMKKKKSAIACDRAANK